MIKNILYQLLLIILPAFSFAQDVTGVWKGELYVDSTKRSYPFELTISENKGKLTGYSRISFEENGIRQIVFRDHTIKIKDDQVIVEDDNQLTKASSISQPKEVKKIMILALNSIDSSRQLSGKWSTNKTKRYLAASGSVSMQQKKDFRTTEIFKKLDSLSLAGKLSFNKPPVVEPVEEKIQLKGEKIFMSALASVKFSRKAVKTPTNVTKPNPLIRPKELPIAKINKEPVVPEVKAVAIAVPIKKPLPQVVKTTAINKPKENAVTKIDKPSVVMASPPLVINNIPKPAEKRNNPAPVQKNAAVDVAKRSVNSIQSFFYKSDSLQLTLYDNGEIDGDTVSVLLNGKVIIAKQGLNTKPNVHTIYFDKDSKDSMMLVMYAENLGSIPPNTGLLVIREGASVYEVRFSADLKTNAAVILRRKNEE